MSGGLARRVSPKKAGGATPATVIGRPSTTSVAPTIDGSPPKCVCHAWYDSIGTGAVADVSCSVKGRPANAPTPNVVK